MMKTLKLYSLIVLTAVSLAVPTGLAQRRATRPARTKNATVLAARGLDEITAAQLRNYLTFSASDEREGRDTPSRGLDTTAKFIAMNLDRWGFKPAGDDGTFFQKIALKRDALDATKTTAEINGQKFAFADDFLPNAVSGTISGPLVYVGNGWVIKSKKMNPYEGIDVKDKIMVVLGAPFPGFPRGLTRADLSGTQGVDWSSPAIYAQQHGAKGVLVIPDSQTAQNSDQLRARILQPARATVEKFSTQPNAPPVPALTMSMKMANVLFDGEKFDAATLVKKNETGETVPAFELNYAKNVHVTIAIKAERPMTQNAVAVWEGGDPVLKNEYVAVGAHYDHVGICAPRKADPTGN